jgi:hypothetical protein
MNICRRTTVAGHTTTASAVEPFPAVHSIPIYIKPAKDAWMALPAEV